MLARLRRLLLAGLCCTLGLAPVAASAQDEQEPFVVTADNMTYDFEREIVTARGQVEISSGARRLLADEIRYDQRQDKVFASGHVALIEPTGDVIFGDTVEVTGDLREGFVKSVGVLMKDDSRLAASQGVRREGNRTTLERAVYSPCPLCPTGQGRPLWQIKAREVVHDQEAQTVSYRHARLEMFGIPVAYAPYFFHPDPTVRRKSGLLAPTFGSTSELGPLITLPYFQVLGPSADVTLMPIITRDEGVVAAGEYRQRHLNGSTELDGSLTYTSPYQRRPEDKKDGKEWRGHIRGTGGYGVTEHSSAGYELFLTTDNSYLERYRIADDDVLTNRLYLEGSDDRQFWGVNGYYYQGLRQFDEQDKIPIVLPLAESRLVSRPMIWGSRVTLDSSLLGLTRIDGLDTRRLSSRVGWEVPKIGPIGDLYRLELSLRGDAYQLDGDPEDRSSTGGQETVGRVLPRMTLDWSWPLGKVGGSWAHQIEPMASFNLAPEGGNNDDIPNEDSRDFEFDETNLFEPSRFPGLDRVEGGTKVAYGVRFSSLGPRATEVSGVFGQSYAFTQVSAFPEESGLRDNLSDYVGRLDLRPSPLLDLSYRFRLGKDDLEFRRSDVLASFGPAALRFNLGYINLSKEPELEEEGEFDLDSREEVVAGLRAQLTPRLAVGGQTRRDLSRNETVANQLGLIYTHPCLTAIVAFEQRFTTTGEIEDDTALLFRLSFQNLGDIEPGIGLLGLN